MCAMGPLNVRSAASTSGAILFTAANNERLTVTGSERPVAAGYTWVPVSGHGKQGWAASKFLKPCPNVLQATAGNAACLNEAGLNLIKSFEGFRSNFYNDAVGVRTIGYGHACQGNACVGIKAPLSQAAAAALLAKDVRTRFLPCVRSAVKKALNNNQMSALTSFAFNLGCGALQGSTLLKKVNAGQFAAAAAEFGKWVKGGGRTLPGLVRRRAAERALFLRNPTAADSKCV